MGYALTKLRVCALTTVAAIMLALSPGHANAQADEMASLDKRSQELFKAGSYAEALAAAEKLAKLTEQQESASGKPGHLTAYALSHVSWYALFANQPKRALAASQRVMEIEPRNLVPMVNRAHALLFLGRIDEARAAYASHRGETLPQQGKWEQVIAKDFAQFRQHGLAQSQLAELEKAPAAATAVVAAAPAPKPAPAPAAQPTPAASPSPAPAATRSPPPAVVPVQAPAPAPAADTNNEQMKLLVQVPQLHMAGKDAEALPLAERLVALSEASMGKENTITANNIGTLADVLAGLGRHGEAEAAYARAIAILEKNGKPIDLSFLPNKLFSLASLYAKERRYADAEPLLKRSLAMREGAQDPQGLQQTGIVLDALGKLYAQWGLYAEAEPVLSRALAIMEKQFGADSPLTGAVLNNLAQVYNEQGRYADAERVMQRAVAISEKGAGPLAKLLGGVNTAGPMLSNLGEINEAQGRYGEAELLFKRALAAAEQDRDKSNLALALNNLASLYAKQGRFAEAEPLLKRSLDTVEKLPGADHPYAAMLLNNLASLYDELGRRSEAEALLKRSLALREKVLGHDHPDVALALNNLAVHYHEAGRYADAEPLMKRAQAIREKTLAPGHPDIASGLNNLAELYSMQNRSAEAEPLHLRAQAIREKALGPNHKDTGESLHNLAGLYMTQGRFEESAQAYKRSLAIFKSALGGDHLLVATSLNNTAELYFKQQDWPQAASYWQRSTDTLIRQFRRGLQGAGAVHAGSGSTGIDQESSRFRRLVKTAYRVAATEPAEAPAIAGRAFEAAQWAQGSTAAQSIAQMAARKAGGEGPLAKLIREQQDLSAEWQVKDKLLTASRSQPAEGRDARVEDGLRGRLAAIDARLAEIAARLAKDFPDYAAFASPEPLTIAQAQGFLKANEALVLFLDTQEKKPLPEETFVWVVTKSASRWVRAPLGTPLLIRKVQALRCGLDFEGSWGEGSLCPELTGKTYTDADHAAGKPLPYDASGAYELYKALFGEVEDMIQGKRLLIAASGALGQLPFQVLVTEAPAAGQEMAKLPWLVRKHGLTVLPAVSSLKALRRDVKASHGGKPYFGIGNPLLNGFDSDGAELARQARGKRICPKQPVPQAQGGVHPRRVARQIYMQGGHVDLDLLRAQSPLPETADELCAVAENLKAQDGSVLLGGEASEASLKNLSERGELASYGILHFATHGALAGQIGPGSEPGLILTPPQAASDLDDGYLSASEIVNLKLDAGWVILSACNTAAGGKENSEALSGLARSFFYAGARSMLVSHWAVNSAATVKLVTGAMAAMTANPNAGRAEALQQAMLGLIDRGTPEEAHPAYWAPFVVAGEGAR